jgi:hypothetical protein
VKLSAQVMLAAYEKRIAALEAENGALSARLATADALLDETFDYISCSDDDMVLADGQAVYHSCRKCPECLLLALIQTWRSHHAPSSSEGT